MYYETVNARRFRLRSFIRFTVDNIFAKRSPQNDYEKLQLKLAKRMLKQFIKTALGVLLSFPLVVIGPVYGVIFQNKYSIPTGVILPFIDPDTLEGFALNMFIQSLAVLVGVAGTLFTELLVSIADSNVYTLKELIISHLRQVDINIQKDNVDWDQIEDEMIKTWNLMDDLCSYIEQYSDIIYYKSFIQPTFTKVCVALAVFLQYVVNKFFQFVVNQHNLALNLIQDGWAAGYGMAAFLCIEIYIFCHAGNNVIVVVSKFHDKCHHFASHFNSIIYSNSVKRFLRNFTLSIGIYCLRKIKD